MFVVDLTINLLGRSFRSGLPEIAVICPNDKYGMEC